MAISQHIALLLVHHLRKMPDSDPVNLINGTTGLSGAVDTLFVLSRNRYGDDSQLYCTGRDIEQRILKLHFDRQSCLWQCVGDSHAKPDLVLPTEMQTFVRFMASKKHFYGRYTELANQFNACAGTTYTPKALSQALNKWRYQLEDCGVSFDLKRSKTERITTLSYTDQPAKDSDATPETST